MITENINILHKLLYKTKHISCFHSMFRVGIFEKIFVKRYIIYYFCNPPKMYDTKLDQLSDIIYLIQLVIFRSEN